jgi:hypothetical protein
MVVSTKGGASSSSQPVTTTRVVVMFLVGAVLSYIVLAGAVSLLTVFGLTFSMLAFGSMVVVGLGGLFSARVPSAIAAPQAPKPGGRKFESCRAHQPN